MENGLGKHFESITLLQLTLFLKTYLPAAVCYATTISMTKLSILAFYWRIFNSQKSIRLPIYVLTLVVICWNIAVVRPWPLHSSSPVHHLCPPLCPSTLARFPLRALKPATIVTLSKQS